MRVLQLTITQNSQATARTITVPTGWDKIATDPSVGGITAVRTIWLQRPKESGDGDTLDITLSGDTGWGSICETLSSSTGADLEIDVENTAANTGLNAAPVATGETTTTANTIVICGYGCDDDDGNATGQPSGMTVIGFRESPFSGNGYSMMLAHVAQASAAATGDKTFSIDASEDWSAALFAIREASSGVSLSPATADLSLAGHAPQVLVPRDLSPATADLALSSTAPTVNLDVFRTPASGALALSTAAPARAIDFRRDPAKSDLSLAGSAPTVEVSGSTDIARDPAKADLSLSATAPSRVIDSRRDPATADLVVTGHAPAVAIDVALTPAAASLTLAGAAPARTIDSRRTPAQADLALATTAPTKIISVQRVPGKADLSLAGHAPSVGIGPHIEPAAAALSLAGFAPDLVTTATFIFAVPAASLQLDGYIPRLGSWMDPQASVAETWVDVPKHL